MKRGKMLRSFTISLLAIGLLAGCSKRTKGYENEKFVKQVADEKIKINPADELADADKYTPTNPEGGVNSDVMPILSAEEQESRIKTNAKAPIVLGQSAANIDFNTSITEGVQILSKPYYSGSEESPFNWAYREGVYIGWGEDSAQGNLVQFISIDDDYKGGFELPGFGTVYITETSLAEINADAELQAQALNALYATYIDETVTDCMSSQACFPYDQNGNKIWVVGQESIGTRGNVYIYFDENFDRVTSIYMSTPNPEWDATALENSQKPILLASGAAGITFDMTKAEVAAALSAPESKDEENNTYTYPEKIMVTWGVNADEGNKPQMIRVVSGYQGTLDVPGIGGITIGQDLTEYVTDLNAFYGYMKDLFNEVNGKDASYNCLETQECSWYDENQTIFLFVNAELQDISVAFFLGANQSIKELLIFTPNPETEVVAQPTATPDNSDDQTNNGQDSGTQVPAGDYSAQAIVPSVGAAGVTWSMTKTQATQFLVAADSGTTSYDLYQGGVIIQWQEDATPGIIYLVDGYQGAFEVPGYAPVGIGTQVSTLFDVSSEQAFYAFARAAYIAAFPGTAADYDCVAAQTCVLSQASNSYYELYLGQTIRIDITPDLSTVAGFLMVNPALVTETPAQDNGQVANDDNNDEVVVEQPATEELPEYASAPIYLGVGAAGIDFTTAKAIANATLVELPTDYSYSVYQGGLIVQWTDATDAATPAIIYVQGEYQGTFTVPGYSPVGLGTQVDTIVDLEDAESLKAFANAAYAVVAPGTAADYDCIAAQTCVFTQASDGYYELYLANTVRIDITPDMATVAGVLMAAPVATEQEEPATEEQTPVATQTPDYAKAPILLGTGLAGMTFETAKADAGLELISESEGGISMYNGGLLVQWGEDSKAVAMLATAGYEGKMTIPGYGELGIGESFANLLGAEASMDDFYAFASAMYSTATGVTPVAEGSTCFDDGTCGFGQDASGNLVFIIGTEQRIQLYLSPNADSITDILMLSPTAEMASN